MKGTEPVGYAFFEDIDPGFFGRYHLFSHPLIEVDPARPDKTVWSGKSQVVFYKSGVQYHVAIDLDDILTGSCSNGKVPDP